MAINVGISFFKAVTCGALFAEAEEASLNLKLATYLIAVKDEVRNRIAFFQGTVTGRRTVLRIWQSNSIITISVKDLLDAEDTDKTLDTERC